MNFSLSRSPSNVAMRKDQPQHRDNTEKAERKKLDVSSTILLPQYLPNAVSATNEQQQNHQQMQETLQPQRKQRQGGWNRHRIRLLFLMVILAIHLLGNAYNTWIVKQFLVLSSITVTKRQGSGWVSIRSRIVSVPVLVGNGTAVGLR